MGSGSGIFLRILINEFKVKYCSASMSSITSAKKALRERITEVLGKIDQNEKKRQSEAVLKKLIALPQYQESKRVSLYLSTPEEIDTAPILEDIFAKSKEAFVPRYQGKKMEMVKLDSMEDYINLPLTKWNIKQPSVKDNRENAIDNGGLDLVILPGVAFTKCGKRCGHGMGYYDKYLHMLTSQSKRPYLVAVAFNEQVQDDIPTTEQDFLLDLILTEK